MIFALIGFKLGHSFSKAYFTKKFETLGLEGYRYEVFSFEDIQELRRIRQENPDLRGLSVTIPHKKTVMPLLDALDVSATEAGAVNTIRFMPDGKAIGYNTDMYGFESSLLSNWNPAPDSHALILGRGGAASAAAAVMRKLNITYTFCVRTVNQPGEVSYDSLDGNINRYDLIVNCTPVGMYPAVEAYPDIPYAQLTDRHFLFDMVYNPDRTQFLLRGIAYGARGINGLEMLYAQAEKAWAIWTDA